MAKDAVAAGCVVAREDVAVGTALQGLQVLSVKAEVGDKVEKGQLLAELEHSGVQSQLAQNEAALSCAKANLASQRSALTEAENTLKRYQALVKMMRSAVWNSISNGPRHRRPKRRCRRHGSPRNFP